jgi:hypothetical protein
MNKKYLVASFLMMLLLVVSQSFSMEQVVFRGAQLVGGGYHIVKGLRTAYQRYNENTAPLVGTPVPPRVEAWVKKELIALNLPQEAQDMPVFYSNNGESWQVEGDRCIMISVKDIDALDQALEMQEKGVCDEAHEDIIALSGAWFKHEVGHYVHKDGIKSVCRDIWVPIAVQAACSSITYGFNTLFKIQPPADMQSVLVRSGLAVASIPLKAVLIKLVESKLSKTQEARADEFACKHATKLELDVWYSYFKLSAEAFEKAILGHSDPQNIKDKLYVRFQFASYDPWHPYLSDRADMIAQEYLRRRGEDHKEKVS